MPESITAVSPPDPATADHDRDLLAQILDDYLRKFERGESLDTEALLASHPDVADRLRDYLSGLALLQRAAADCPPAFIPTSTLEPKPGATLGDFRLVREIGRGGMGIVFEAWQRSLGRRVAVKVLPFSAAVQEKQIARFKHEAHAAAQIDHPHIVPVFAIGQEGPIHYFAMQRIGGQSLAELITELREEVDQSLEGNTEARSSSADTRDHVFAVSRMGVQAAEALDAAHEIGVVHRDVKPSNLLLDEKGKVWITDFGVARCKTSTCLTETGYVVGSLPYMSPEQALGQPALVDHRTDIYSLGVTLYELATLRHPCEGSAHAETAIEYHRSQWRRPRCWNADIPVDFENIILKALAEARDERYATARELADDLRRFLEGKPIVARAPSLSSRVEKWVRRHQRTVAAAFGALALGIIGLVVSLVMINTERAEKEEAYRLAMRNSQRAERNYLRAEAKFRQAREVVDRFGTRVNELLASDLPGAEEMRKKLLEEMLPYYREFAREARSDPALQNDLAVTQSKIGFLCDQLGALTEAEQAYRDSQAIFQHLVHLHPSENQHRRRLALCSNNLGHVLKRRGAMAAAQTEMERALALQQALADHEPQNAEIQSDLATTNCNLGLLFSQTGDRPLATKHLQAAVTLQEAVRRAAPQNEHNLHRLAASYNNLSGLELATDPAAARRWVEQALRLQLALVKEHPQRREYQSDLAASFNNLGAIHSRGSRWKDAQLCYRDAITIQERLVDVAPLVKAYQRDLAASLNNLGLAQTRADDFTAAESSFEQARSLQSLLVAENPRDLNLRSGLAGIYNNLGMVQQKCEQLSEAAELFEESIKAQREVYQQAPTVARFREMLSKHYFNYAAVLRALDRPAEAANALMARRDLWRHDRQRLLKVADELMAVSKEIGDEATRRKVVAEATATRRLAAAVKTTPHQNAPGQAFDVQFADSHWTAGE